jgi:hypothetical protein
MRETINNSVFAVELAIAFFARFFLAGGPFLRVTMRETDTGLMDWGAQ